MGRKSIRAEKKKKIEINSVVIKMTTEIHYKPPERSPLQRLIALLLNEWFWWKLLQKILKYLFPAWYPVAKLYHPALDAKLISLDGKNEVSLLNDYVKKMPPHMPLVIHMGSYN